MNRLQHDSAHRIVVKRLTIVAPALRGEEQQEFYWEAMPVVMEELGEFETRRAREAKRLARPDA